MSAELVSGLPPPQRLALAYSPAASRAPTLALLALDERLAAVVRTRREPIASQMRLAWWRDLIGSQQAAWPAGEPLVTALHIWRDASGLAGLVDGWEAMLADRLTPDVIDDFVEGRAQAFSALARELGTDADPAAQAARIWAVADLVAHLSDPAEQDEAMARAKALPPPPRLSGPLRPLAVLAALGAAALARGGGPLIAGPGSALIALRAGFTGR